MINQLIQMMKNPAATGIKEQMFQVLQERYRQNEKIIERISSLLENEDDVRGFLSLALSCYESGFIRCLEEQKEKLKELGIDVTVVANKPPPTPEPENQIFR